MATRFRECLPPCERTRPILCLTSAELDRLAQLAEVTRCSFSEMVEMVVRDWLTTDLEQLAEMGQAHSYPSPRVDYGVGE